jgi:1,4-alpha-glucan branching enzyme
MKYKNQTSTDMLDSALGKLCDARHHDPYSVLGRVTKDYSRIIRAFIPFCQSVQIGENGPFMERLEGTDIFEIVESGQHFPKHYQFHWVDHNGQTNIEYDPYSFDPTLPDYDIHLFNEGKHWHLYRLLGAHEVEIDSINGTRFAVWAPNAQRVSIISDMNRWDGRRHPMQSMGESGVWSLFIPEMKVGMPYKYEICNRYSNEISVESDPFAQEYEFRPKTASVITRTLFKWKDQEWTQRRETADWLHDPMSIYEVHLGSWHRNDDGSFPNYRDIAEQLLSYVKAQGFTHIELLPLCEHPFDDSWGYQTVGYFAATSRFGHPDDLRFLINLFHENGIGVILDWVPAHFPKDEHGLIKFDGTALFEHEDSRLGEHPDWGTLIFNFGRKEVKNFLLASAIYWLEEFHIDGLRVDAVASLIYLDYSRKEGEWIPNRYGGNENIEAIEFLRELNSVTHDQFPGTLILAEESTAWPMVTRPASDGGLGFSMKWNMGWMHDTLQYMEKEPVHRKHHHDRLTFGLLYAFSENFILPFSHDEVVHGKGSLLSKMPGDEWQRYANLRLLYVYMFTYPGKKLLFMGCEFGQGTEWNHNQSLDWYVLDYQGHQGIQKLVQDLNTTYASSVEWHFHDFEPAGFTWLDCENHDQSIIAYARKAHGKISVVILNFTPVERHNYRVGVPQSGTYQEIINSDSTYYGGSNMGNPSATHTEDISWHGFDCSITLTIPPLAGLVLRAV